MRIVGLLLLVQCMCVLVSNVSSNLAESLERYGFQDTKKYQQHCGDISKLQRNECYIQKSYDVNCFNVSVRYDMCKSIDVTADHGAVSADDPSTKSWQALKAFHNRHNGNRRRHMYFDGACVEVDEGKCSLYRCEVDCCPIWRRDPSGQCSIPKGMHYCENGGTYDFFKRICSCPYGFSGSKCENPICDPGCHNNGVCYVTSVTGQRTCACRQFTSGKLCEHVICADKCEHGECIMDGVTPVCLCDPGYYGKTCQHAYNHDSTCPVPRNIMCSNQNLNCQDECTMDDECGAGDVCCSDGCCNSCIKSMVQRCYHNGQVYHPRQSFQKDKCTTCQCLTSGRISCNRKSCPVLNCVETENLPGDCCPSCKDVASKNRDSIYPFNFTWSLGFLMKPTFKSPWGDSFSSVGVAANIDLGHPGIDTAFTDTNLYLGGVEHVRYTPPRVWHCKCLDKYVTNIEVSAMEGNTTVATCQQPVIVVDIQSPVFLLCPGSMSANEGDPVNWREPIADDNVGVDTLESNYNRGSIFSSSVEITYIATDYDRNRAFCSFSIYVSINGDNSPEYDLDKTSSSSVVMIVGVIGTALIIVIVVTLAIIYRRNRLKHSQYGQNNRPNTRQQQNRCQRHPQNVPINAISNHIYGEMLSSDGRMNTNDFTPLPPPYSPARNPPPYEEVQQHTDNDIKPPDYEMVISQDRDGISV